MTKVAAVESVNNPDDIGERVVRYRDVRCRECSRMFWCVYWEDVGYPHVNCQACGIEYSWPFEEIEGLEHRYRHGEWPVGENP